MDHLPAQDEDYRNLGTDQITLVAEAPEMRIRVVYKDWDGNTQKRLLVRGTWPLKTSMFLGFEVPEYSGGTQQWSEQKDLSELGFEMELSVGWSAGTTLPQALRRGR